MAKDILITGIDIGGSKVAICAATINEEDKVQIVGLSAVPHTGLRKGVIADPEETVTAISNALDDVERMTGMPITHAFVSVNGAHVETVAAKGVIAISKANGLIDNADTERAIEAAKVVAMPQNRELLHVFPQSFTVDNQDEIRDPIGMTGMRLESNTLIISAATAALRNLQRAVEQAGVGIDSLVFSPLAMASLVTNKKQRESGVVLIDIGSSSTGLAIYEDGELKHCACLPIGSNNITRDIAIGLKINLEVAEKIKVKYGSVDPAKIRDSETIALSNFDPAEHEKVSRKQLAEIINARVGEIFSLVKDELKQVEKDEVLPAGAILTGGGSLLDGIVDEAKHSLKIPASIGYPIAPISGLVDKLDDPVYYASVGLVVWGAENSREQAVWHAGLGNFGGVVDRLRGLFKNFTS